MSRHVISVSHFHQTGLEHVTTAFFQMPASFLAVGFNCCDLHLLNNALVLTYNNVCFA
jgi:hypothetical protein